MNKNIKIIKEIEKKIKILNRILKDSKQLCDYDIKAITSIDCTENEKKFLFDDEYISNIEGLINDYKDDLATYKKELIILLQG